jgi:MFS family permease
VDPELLRDRLRRRHHHRGRARRRFGRRRIFNLGLALFTIASGACALAPSASELIAARTVQGLGGAIVLPLSLTILTTAFPAERRGTIVGIYGGLAGLALPPGHCLAGR